MDATRTSKDRPRDDVRRERRRRSRLVRHRHRMARRRQHPRLFVSDPCYRLQLEALAEPRRSIAEVSPDEDYGRRVSAWNDLHHRTQADGVRLYDVTIARVAAAA